MNKDDMLPAIAIIAFSIILIVGIVSSNIGFDNELEQRLTNLEHIVNNINKK